MSGTGKAVATQNPWRSCQQKDSGRGPAVRTAPCAPGGCCVAVCACMYTCMSAHMHTCGCSAPHTQGRSRTSDRTGARSLAPPVMFSPDAGGSVLETEDGASRLNAPKCSFTNKCLVQPEPRNLTGGPRSRATPAQ